MESTTCAGTVLLVEDDPAIQGVVSEALRAEGYRVALAATFEQAVDAMAHTHFDCVLADVLGATSADPQANHWTILERIRALASYQPVIIFTAHRASDFAGYRERGFRDLLLKPFDLDELLATVARHCTATPSGATPERALA